MGPGRQLWCCGFVVMVGIHLPLPSSLIIRYPTVMMKHDHIGRTDCLGHWQANSRHLPTLPPPRFHCLVPNHDDETGPHQWNWLAWPSTGTLSLFFLQHIYNSMVYYKLDYMACSKPSSSHHWQMVCSLHLKAVFISSILRRSMMSSIVSLPPGSSPWHLGIPSPSLP